MSNARPRCAAITKAGTPCKNHARADSAYCGVHKNYVAAGETPTGPTGETPTADQDAASTAKAGSRTLHRADFELLVQELNSLAEELQRSYPSYVPPQFSPSGMLTLVKQNLDKFRPDIQLELLSDLRANLEGTSPKDFVDPDTWKGLWYILNYTAQAQSKAALEKVCNRLASLPGMGLLSDMKGNLEGTSPKEFLDPDTWKGMYLIMNYSARATAGDLKRRILGDEDDE